MEKSTTLYIGNLSFYTTEEQIYELFSKCGEIKRVIMGLDRNTKTPCGFCFVEYYDRFATLDSLKYINGTKLDERIIRTDIDAGFKDGRQFGRGKSGGQVRDEYRDMYDPGRGGWGVQERIRLERERERKQRGTYENYSAAPVGTTVDAFGRSLELRQNIKKGRIAQMKSNESTKRSRDDDDDEEEEQVSRNNRFREESD